MDIIKYLNEVFEYIKAYGKLPDDNIININSLCLTLYNKTPLDENDLEVLDILLKICNLVYENLSYTLIEDEFYDQLIEKYKAYRASFRIGAENISAPVDNSYISINNNSCVSPLIYNTLDRNDMLYYNDLSYNRPLDRKDLVYQNYTIDNTISKRTVDAAQLYPELVGTLDKVKFVMNSQAEEKGVLNDSNVKIFERDFLGKHLREGLINNKDTYTLTAELKYDGVSICAKIKGNTIVSARTRGEVGEEIAADLTPIFQGYQFTHLDNDPNNEFGAKFEAIMTRYNLYRYNQVKGRNYANCRTAIIGLLNSSDVTDFREYITLIPLEVSFLNNNYNRDLQLEWINKFLSGLEVNRYSILQGDYIQLLFQVKRFVEEAEMMRDYIPYMYDGVVISYNDTSIRNRLGRENSVNKYSIAIKFNALKKQTMFTGYTFTVGQDGSITPMIHFNPISFFGSIHDKSTGHSYDRFKKLGLRKGDLIDVEYTNDVMCYVTKPENSHNLNNTNPLEVFPDTCPCCGSRLEISASGKSVKCTNIQCPERNLKRLVNMFGKLNIKDFSEAYLSKIGVYSLEELFKLTVDDVKFLGEVNSQKFIDNMKMIQTKEIYDYKIVGALGFTNVSTEKWKLILSKLTVNDIIIGVDIGALEHGLKGIKGIGPGTITTIINEIEFFYNDLCTISRMPNVKSIKEDLNKINIKKIRFTGVRDRQLMNMLSDMGHDVGDGSVTNDTDILVVPYLNYTSSKTNKVISKGLKTIIVPIDDFKNNLNTFLK